MLGPACSDHHPQGVEFPWGASSSGGLLLWCSACGSLEIDGEFIGCGWPDADGWLFQPAMVLNWISVQVAFPPKNKLTS